MIAIFLTFLLGVLPVNGSSQYDPLAGRTAEILQDVLDKKRSFVVNKQSCISKKEPFGKVISCVDVREVEYLNNHRIAITTGEEKRYMIDLHSNEQWEFSKPFMMLNCTMPIPENTEKVLDRGSDGCANIRIHEGFPYKKSNNAEFGYNSLFLPVYLDENQLPLIWVKKSEYSLKKIYAGYQLRDIKVYDSVYHSSLDPNRIISQCKEKFTTYYNLNQLLFENDFCTISRKTIDFYAFDRQFIIQCAPKTNYHGALCTIFYSDTRRISKIYLLIDICSIVLHPTIKDFFAVMLSKDKTIQYWNSQGILLATQKRSIREKDVIKEATSDFGDYLSFSPDGTHLAALFPKEEEVVIFNVPLRAQIEPKKLIFILCCLKNQQFLPKDIAMYIFNIFRS